MRIYQLEPAASSPRETARVYHYDHLGSITAITDWGSTSGFSVASGNKTGRYSEDAWGQRRDPLDWTGAPTAATDDGGPDSLTPRGFTGHEMLDDLGLVHMNGRIYDPLLGRLLSADTYVQFAYELQSYNRYAYVRNNPLTAIDPSGFLEVVEDQYRGEVLLNNGYIVSQQYGSRIESLVYNLNVAIEKADKPAESLYRNQVVAELERLKGPFAMNPRLILYLAENPEVGAKMLDAVVASTALAIEAYGNKGAVPQGAVTEGARSAHDINASSIKNRQIRGVDESMAKPTGRRTANGDDNMGGDKGRYSGQLEKVNKPDQAADDLAKDLGGQSRVKFSSDSSGREFDAVSKDFIAQAKPGLSTVSKGFRDQAKATFEAAGATGRSVYYRFSSAPAKEVIDKLNQYAERYKVKLVIEIKK